MGKKDRIKRGKAVAKPAPLTQMATTQISIRSSVRGWVGVFAHTAISRGCVVAVYPATVSTDPASVYNVSSGGVRYQGSPWSGPVPSQPMPTGAHVAHLMNDAEMMAQHGEGWPGLLQFMKDYSAYVNAGGGNVVRVGDSLNFVAKRDILEGEELTYTYGWPYWLAHYLMPLNLMPYANFITSILMSVLANPLGAQQLTFVLGSATDEELSVRTRAFFEMLLFSHCHGIQVQWYSNFETRAKRAMELLWNSSNAEMAEELAVLAPLLDADMVKGQQFLADHPMPDM
jgi:hypothetical protein